MTKRRNKLLKNARALGARAVLITSSPSLRYLVGFSGSSGVCLLTEDASYFITDFRYSEQVKAEVAGCEFRITPKPPLDYIIEERLLPKNTPVGIEDLRIPYQDFRKLAGYFPAKNLLPLGTGVSGLQQVKDEDEIRKIRRAAEITDAAFRYVRETIGPGITENEIAAEIAYQIRKNGGDKEGFDTIVASGPRSAMPHAKTGARAVSEGELVVMDFGAVFEGYHADLTRTVILGEPARDQREIYVAVREAQEAAIASARAGISCAGLDGIARKVIADRGFNEFFGHGLGHGLGLEIHEAPRLSPSSEGRLKSGNVVTIEPGIYIPGMGGVRIEDDVLITKDGCEVLTAASKELVL